MKLSVIIPTRDRGKIFDQTLQAAVAATSGLDAEILVVNDSPTGTPEIPAGFNARMLSSHGKGVATARNRGAAQAAGDLLLFMDDDVVVDATSIRQIMALHDANDHMALNPDWCYPPDLVKALGHSAFGRFLFHHGMTSFEGWYADAKTWKTGEIFESKSVASFHLSLKRKDFERTGGYDESFPFAGFEDHDFPLRLKKAGISFRIDTRIRVFHNEEDRLNLKNWLASQERRAFTRAVAVRNGYHHLALSYSPFKRLVHSLGSMGLSAGTALMSSWPFGKWMDSLAFAWIGYLQASRIYRGYDRGMKS